MNSAHRFDKAEIQLRAAYEEIDLSDRDRAELESTIASVQFLRDRYMADGQEADHD